MKENKAKPYERGLPCLAWAWPTLSTESMAIGMVGWPFDMTQKWTFYAASFSLTRLPRSFCQDWHLAKEEQECALYNWHEMWLRLCCGMSEVVFVTSHSPFWWKEVWSSVHKAVKNYLQSTWVKASRKRMSTGLTLLTILSMYYKICWCSTCYLLSLSLSIRAPWHAQFYYGEKCENGFLKHGSRSRVKQSNFQVTICSSHLLLFHTHWRKCIK